ncbi:hypothetical protein BGW80DRAFT_1529051 [Lactifluus volemus]|nr:hypothetical protein BGW80DRAFT_1529051 [Lactifluus volemus]
MTDSWHKAEELTAIAFLISGSGLPHSVNDRAAVQIWQSRARQTLLVVNAVAVGREDKGASGDQDKRQGRALAIPVHRPWLPRRICVSAWYNSDVCLPAKRSGIQIFKFELRTAEWRPVGLLHASRMQALLLSEQRLGLSSNRGQYETMDRILMYNLYAKNLVSDAREVIKTEPRLSDRIKHETGIGLGTNSTHQSADLTKERRRSSHRKIEIEDAGGLEGVVIWKQENRSGPVPPQVPENVAKNAGHLTPTLSRIRNAHRSLHLPT